jgi:hypothetical protein
LKLLLIQSVLVVNLIRLKLMKVIYSLKNKINEEFQHLIES